MSATSDGLSFEGVGLSSKVINDAFQFLENGNQNECLCEFDEPSNKIPSCKGEDLTVSQLYCLTNKENAIEVTLNESIDDNQIETLYVSGMENNKQSIRNSLSEEFKADNRSQSEIKSNRFQAHEQNQGITLKCTNEAFDQEELMTVSQLHEIISVEEIPEAEYHTDQRGEENELTVSQLYCLTANQTQNQDNHCAGNPVCDRLSDGQHDAEVNEDQKHSFEQRFNKFEKVESLKAENGDKSGSQCPNFSSEKTKENSNWEDIELLQKEAVSVGSEQPSQSCTGIQTLVDSTTKILHAEAGTSVGEITLALSGSYHGLERGFSSYSQSESKCDGNPGGSTSDMNCDKSGNMDKDDNDECAEQVNIVGDKVLKNNSNDDRVDNNEAQLMNNYSQMDVLNKEHNVASGSAPDAQCENKVTLCNKNDSCGGQLSSENAKDLVSNTCLDKEICHVVYNLDQEISSVLEKCEYLLQRPPDRTDVEDPEGANVPCFVDSDTSGQQCVISNVDESNIENSHNKNQSSQVSPQNIMGTTVSTEKLEKIRERSKLHNGHDVYIGPNYEGVDLEKTSAEFDHQQVQHGESTTSSSKKDGHTIKGTILPNMENSLFGETDTSGSIQGNYEQSHHQIAGDVSHEFNHLGKQGDSASAISDTSKSQHQGSLTCSENTGKAQSDKNLDEQKVLNKHSNKNFDLPESNPNWKGQDHRSSSLLQSDGQGHKEGQHITSKDTDVVIRKDILRSPKLRSPKMSPLLRERRFRHGRVGSGDSGSGSDQESVDSQRSEDSDEDDDDAGNYRQKHWRIEFRRSSTPPRIPSDNFENLPISLTSGTFSFLV